MASNDDDKQWLVRARDLVDSARSRADKASGGALSRMSEKVRETVQDRLAPRVKDALQYKLAPAIEERIREMVLKLAEPENAERLQETLASIAQFGMKRGFEQDPDARLLFEFVDWLERRHSRALVMEVVVKHGALMEHTLIQHLQKMLERQRAGLPPERGDGWRELRDEGQQRLLELLTLLVTLETGEPAPATQEAQVEYIEGADIPERFKILAHKTVGAEGAFDEAPDTAQPDTTVTSDDSRLEKWLGSREDRKSKKKSALQRFAPSMDDPHTRFLTASHLFFVQSYLVRAMVENLPGMLSEIAELEKASRSHEEYASDDVVDISEE
ncbi:MAG: hypothetical protein ACQEVA_22875 [Myxococcota bacterium]